MYETKSKIKSPLSQPKSKHNFSLEFPEQHRSIRNTLKRYKRKSRQQKKIDWLYELIVYRSKKWKNMRGAFGYLLFLFYKHDGRVFPSWKTISGRGMMSKTTLGPILHYFEEHGLIKRKRNPYQSNDYIFSDIFTQSYIVEALSRFFPFLELLTTRTFEKFFTEANIKKATRNVLKKYSSTDEEILSGLAPISSSFENFKDFILETPSTAYQDSACPRGCDCFDCLEQLYKAKEAVSELRALLLDASHV